MAVLLVTALYGAMLVRLPAPTPAGVSLQPAEVMILPPGDPEQEIAAVGSPDSIAAQASDGLQSAPVAEPSELELTEELTPAKRQASEVKTVEAVEAAAITSPLLQAEPPLEAVESAVVIAPKELDPAEISDRKPMTDAPVKREVVKTEEVEKRKPWDDAKNEPAKKKSASSPAQRGHAGSGGGQRTATAQSIAAYAAHVRSVLVSRTQRIRNLRSSGRVGLTFTINADGRLASLSLRSSGRAEIDQAVRASVRGAIFPPPPNGRFRGSITITVR
jgi:TonB family protein